MQLNIQMYVFCCGFFGAINILNQYFYDSQN